MATDFDESGHSAEQTETQRLRARVAELEGQLAARPITTDPPGPPSRARWRTVVAVVLVTVGCLLAPLAVLSVWASDELSDTDRYVQTVAPLADDPGVQQTITNTVTEAVFTRIDVESLVTDASQALADQGVPPRVTDALSGLSSPIANGVEGFVRDEVTKIVASPQFAQAWDEANRVAHEQIDVVLSGEQGGAVSAQNDQITLNLGPFVEQVKERLVAEGLTVAENIPEVDAQVVLVQSEQITRWQSFYRLLNTLGTWLPFIALGFVALGVYVAKNHRRALVGGALGVAGAMLVLGVGLALVRVLYLDAVPTDVVPQDTAASVFDTLVRFLRQAGRTVLLAALVVAVAAFLSGGSVTAVQTRRGLSRGIGALRGGAESAGLRTGRLGSWVYDQRHWLRVGVVAIAAAVVVFWTRPTPAVVLTTAVVALVALGVVEFLARPPQPVGPLEAEALPGAEEAPSEAGTAPEAAAIPRQPSGEPADDTQPRPLAQAGAADTAGPPEDG